MTQDPSARNAAQLRETWDLAKGTYNANVVRAKEIEYALESHVILLSRVLSG